MGGREISYIRDAISSNWIAPAGANIDGFEKDLSEYLGIENVVALSSGTAAIHLALINLGIQKGDYVLCSSFTFAASANPILYLGAIPVFIDAESSSWNMSPELLEEGINDLLSKNRNPAAIILVHLYGMPANINAIMDLARKYNIPVIEDAAEALGSSYGDRKLGSFGNMGILSFNGNKIITASTGGALVSDNKEYISHARFLATQARDDYPHYEHSQVGYNYRMSNIIAGIGRGQMEVLQERIHQRRKVNERYRRYLADCNDRISFHEEWSPQCFSNFWLTALVFRDGDEMREKVRLELEHHKIEARPLWKPMHLQPVFSDCISYLNGISEELFTRGLCVPSGSSLKEKEIQMISEIILNQL